MSRIGAVVSTFETNMNIRWNLTVKNTTQVNIFMFRFAEPRFKNPGLDGDFLLKFKANTHPQSARVVT